MPALCPQGQVKQFAWLFLWVAGALMARLCACATIGGLVQPFTQKTVRV
jgi:hypothetical protein